MTRYERIREEYEAAGQVHVFRLWERLDERRRLDLLDQLERIDLDLVRRMAGGELGTQATSDTITRSPAPVLRLDQEPETGSRRSAAARGEELLRAGKVGLFLVAGGQSSRLGASGPKGCVDVGPLSGLCLFELHAGKILHLRDRLGASIPWYIMTSRANDASTRSFFAEHDYLGLPRQDVYFLPQAMLPALDTEGKLILEEEHKLFESPGGHGGAYSAFADGGGLENALERGLAHIFYFQVDNPLVRIADPLFVGLHDLMGADMSLKVLEKTGPEEKIGVVALENGSPRVVEYSDLSHQEAHRRDDSGRLVFWAGSIAIHAFSLKFIERVAHGGIQLPYHVARKEISALDARGERQVMEASKFETFVFDALPFTDRFLNMEVVREREFAPIKNREGVDSLQSGRRLLIDEHRRWLRRLGIEILGDVEVSPRAALGWRDLVEPLAPLKGKRYEGNVIVDTDQTGRVRLRELGR